MPLGVYEAETNWTTSGATRPFEHRFLTDGGGLQLLVACIAVTGVWDGATITLEFYLADEWHETEVALSASRQFWKIPEGAALVGECYRFVVSGAGALTDLTFRLAAPEELVLNGGGP